MYLEIAVHDVVRMQVLKGEDYFSQVEARDVFREPSGLVQVEEEFASGTEVEDQVEVVFLRVGNELTDWKA